MPISRKNRMRLRIERSMGISGKAQREYDEKYSARYQPLHGVFSSGKASRVRRLTGEELELRKKELGG